MDTLDKLKILSQDSRYDLACACGTNEQDRRRRGLDSRWLYPVTLPDGGYSVLLKTLLSNACENDCGYCPLRADSDVRRCTLEPEEVAALFMQYLRRREVFGLFLSSGVINNPDFTMDRLNAVASLLRYKHKFRGYIHLKVIPGASDAAIEEAARLASALSLNIETPGRIYFDKLSQRKDFDKDIIRPIKLLSKLTERGSRHYRVRCTTQFIVGASDERDTEIVRYMFGLYDKLEFDRIYFSSYQKGLGKPDIPGEAFSLANPERPFMREHRLYQVDFLIRKYGFKAGDILTDGNGNLSIDKDPKEVWADNHPDFFPVRLSKAGREELLRVPGLGLESVRRIIQVRSEGRIGAIENLGIKGKRLQKVRSYVEL
jgi:predicted DNA-binding helix-hairpin-helix protein